MYTGLIQNLGVVNEVSREEEGMRLTVGSELAAELNPGDSVTVNGVCQTVVDLESSDQFSMQAMRETLSRSTLGELKPGDQVNLELPLRADERLGGHFVQGHVDGVGSVVEAISDGFALKLTIEANPDLLRYLVEKGSVTVDGVSLTITSVTSNRFKVSLIPETQQRTTLGSLKPGRRVNLEVDVLAKYVEKLIPHDRTNDQKAFRSD